jgi:hypothetical protein
LLNLNNIKKSLSYIPIKSDSNEFTFSHPLGMVKRRANGVVDIYIANIKVTSLHPQYFELASQCKEAFSFEIDGKETVVSKASTFLVSEDFKVIKDDAYRVNIIGYHGKKAKDESGEVVSLAKLNRRYAVDTQHKTYRVEFYKNNEFCTMIMAKFK